MGYPVLAEAQSLGNVFGEHVYKIRTTFGAASAVTFRALCAKIEKLGTGEWKISLQQAYKEVTDFSCGWQRASGSATLEMQITSNDLATDGTVTVKALDSTGTATDPTAGDVAYITLGVSQDVQNDKYVG